MSRVPKLLDQVNTEANRFLFGKPVNASTVETPDEIAASHTEANPHPQGFWQIVAELARQKGATRAEAIAKAKANEDRTLKQREQGMTIDNLKSEIERRTAETRQGDARNTNDAANTASEKALRDANITNLTDDNKRAADRQQWEMDNPPTEVVAPGGAVVPKNIKAGQPFAPLWTNPKDEHATTKEIADPKDPTKSKLVREVNGHFYNTENPANTPENEVLTARGYDRPFNNADAHVTEDDIASIAERVVGGRTVPSLLGYRDNTRPRVEAYLERYYPDFNTKEAEANFAYSKSSGFQTKDRAMVSLNGVGELVKSRAEQLGQGKFVALNKAILAGETQFSDPLAIKYYNNLTDFAELTAQSFGGNPSDYKIQLTNSLLNKGYSAEGIAAAVDATLEAVVQRRKANTAGTTRDVNVPSKPPTITIKGADGKPVILTITPKKVGP